MLCAAAGPLRVETYPEAEVPPQLRLQVLALQEQAWPSGAPVVLRATHDPALEPESMLLVVDGLVVSALDVLTKTIDHAGTTFLARGLSTVVTDLALRGRGYGLHLVRHAHEAIARSGADLGLFTCDTPLGAFYERAGWRLLPGTVLVGGTPDAPFPSDQFDKVTLGDFFTDRAKSHAADFRGARIELYPGAIDKLW